MKILWHSNAPWSGTGYGQQTALWTPRIKALGHDIVISAFYGLAGGAMKWNDIIILSGGHDNFGADIIIPHMQREKADLVITLCDIWVLNPQELKGNNVAHWMPVDTNPLGMMDAASLQMSGAIPIAMSLHGEQLLRNAGFDTLYVPHGIDTQLFAPGQRDAVREEMGLSDRFIIGMNSANKDPFRKAAAEQLLAFAKLYRKHKDAFLLIHSQVSEPGSIDMAPLIRSLGIGEAVRFVDQYEHLTGRVTPPQVAAWYNCLDLFTQCSMGEGFGLPALEAQACGVPVAVTAASAMPQVCGVGWQVTGEKLWNPTHKSWWVKPSINDIYHAYEEAYNGEAAKLRGDAPREFALTYDADRVMEDYWKPALSEIEERIKNRDVAPRAQ